MKLFFNHKLTGADFTSNIAWFEQQKKTTNIESSPKSTQNNSTEKNQVRPTEISVSFNLLIGADGAHSATRYHLMKYARLAYQQEYIDTLWCEFHIPPKECGSTFAMSPNHLHIWPGGSFMFIAIPSIDRSFTCTLFASSSDFASLSNSSTGELLAFFAKNFPGVCPELIPPEDLQKQFYQNPHLPLISIKCTPYHHKSGVVILGDAAHAMVPFYGQGMNAGLEDVRVCFDILEKHGVYDSALSDNASRMEARRRALMEYTEQRTPDAAAINNLALRNYEEMRAGVQSPLYRMRKWIEESVNLYLPSLGWNTQYSRVSFENQRYSDVEKAVQKQGRILVVILGLSIMGIGGLISVGIAKGRLARKPIGLYLFGLR